MIELLNADAVAIPLASGSVNLIVTSPPYFGLRRYNAGPGEIGSEASPAEFVEAMRAVAAECWRVLREDGCMILNLGDSFNGSGGAGGDYGPGGLKDGQPRYPGRNDGAIPPGSRIGIPWRVAFALMDDGWTLRQEVIWQKLSAMPEAVDGWSWQRHRVKVASVWTDANPHPSKTGGVNYTRDNHAEWSDCPGCPTCAPNGGLVLKKGGWRPTTAHEQIFVFVKGMGYFGDREAVKEASIARTMRGNSPNHKNVNGAPGQTPHSLAQPREHGEGYPISGANPRSVMTFPATPYKGAHYATFPTTLPEFFIRAYTPEAGCCSECGEPWARVVESETIFRKRPAPFTGDDFVNSKGRRPMPNDQEGSRAQSLGFRRTCAHDAPARPAIVLDPFAGSGSTLIAARALGRDGIGIDLSLDYLLHQAKERLSLNAVDAWTNGKGKAGGDVAGLPMWEVTE